MVGTRPEIIKLSSLIKRLDKFLIKILFTGQNYDYELNQIFLNLKIRNQTIFKFSWT